VKGVFTLIMTVSCLISIIESFFSAALMVSYFISLSS
jgi:hypothetical protein